MVDKGNYGDPTTTETPRIEKVLGQDVKVYSNDKLKTGSPYKDWFMVDGSTFTFRKDTHSKIPRNVENPSDSRLKDTESMDDYLQAIGQLYYGARWNTETSRFEPVKGLERYPSVPEIQKHMLKFSGMETTGEGRNIIPVGYGTSTLKKRLKLVRDLNLAGKPKEEDAPITESVGDKQQLIIKLTRENFENQQYIQEWKKRARKTFGTAKAKIESHVNNLYRLCAINGRLGYPQYYTEGYAGLNYDQKVADLKQDFERFKHFATTRNTPPEWWDQLMEFGFDVEGGMNDGEHLDWLVGVDKIKDTIDDWQVKMTRQLHWTKKSGMSAVKVTADAIANFISQSSPTVYWSLEDQPKESVLQRRAGEPTKASLGQDLTDEEIQAGMKFLETGYEWIWETRNVEPFWRIRKGKGKISDLTVKEKESFVKSGEIITTRRFLILNPKDWDGVPDINHPERFHGNPHYNTTLKAYKKWGKPYGRLSPANMFFRLALSGTGWRKAEALTCRNAEISETTFTEEDSGWYFKKDKLKIVFQTRKTERIGQKYAQHTSTIPPHSSKLIDSRHTIELVMEKGNVYTYDANGNKRALDQEERIKARPQKMFGKGKKTFLREEGGTSKVLIGQDNQFINVDTIRTKLGSDLHFENPNLIAFLYVPFKELYSLMPNTGVKIRLPADVTALRKQYKSGLKPKSQKGFKFFEMDKWGWATSYKKPKIKRGKITGYDIITDSYDNDKVKQDADRIDDTSQKYWAKKPLHSIRHVFAQTWLRKSQWNFGLVSLFGHWKIIDTLKLHYGERNDDTAIDQMMGLFAQSDNEQETADNLERLEGVFDETDAQELKKSTADQELSDKEKKNLTEMGEDSGDPDDPDTVTQP